MPKVSVIIPFFNRIDWVKEAIESVLCQSYQDFEIILVDDGSSEDTSTLMEYAKRGSISIYRQENQGPAAARNYGIQLAKSDYIAFLDSDDLFTPNKLETQIKLMYEQPDAVLCHTSYQRMEQTGELLEVIHSGAFGGSVFPRIYDGCPIATPSVLVKKSVFDQITGFNQEIRIAEDVLLWGEISRLGPIIGIDEPLTLVRMHGQNAATDYSAQIIGESNIIKYGLVNNKYIAWLEKQKLLSKKHQNIAAYSYYHFRDYKKAIIYTLLAILYYAPGGLKFIYSQFAPIIKGAIKQFAYRFRDQVVYRLRDRLISWAHRAIRLIKRLIISSLRLITRPLPKKARDFLKEKIYFKIKKHKSSL